MRKYPRLGRVRRRGVTSRRLHRERVGQEPDVDRQPRDSARHRNEPVSSHPPTIGCGEWELTGSFRWRALSPPGCRSTSGSWPTRSSMEPPRGHAAAPDTPEPWILPHRQRVPRCVRRRALVVRLVRPCRRIGLLRRAEMRRRRGRRERDGASPAGSSAGPDSSSLRCQCSTRASVSTTSHQLAASAAGCRRPRPGWPCTRRRRRIQSTRPERASPRASPRRRRRTAPVRACGRRARASPPGGRAGSWRRTPR